MEPINIILCGDAVAEIDALIAAIIGKQLSPIPEDNLLAALRDPATIPNLAPGVTIGETYGKPPTLMIPLARAKAFPHGGTLLHQLGCHAENAEPTSEIALHMYHAKEPSLLLQTTIKPHVLVLCFVPAIPQTFEALNATWVPTIDRLYPRPPVVLCGTRAECTAVKAVEHVMTELDLACVDEEDICDRALRSRCLQYVEVSAALLINTAALEEGILKAAFGEPEKRLLPEAITAMRKACTHAAKLRQASWAWKRHPKTNRLFYFNRVTKAKQYKRPADYDGDDPELTAEERIEDQRRKLEEEELRMEREREEADVDQMREELMEYSSRMSEKSERYNALVAEASRLQTALDRLRDQQQANINDRQALERERDEIGHDQMNFSKSSVDQDREFDSKMAIARSKMFQLEAVAALRAEDAFAGEITEALVGNSGIASAIRDVLKEEVEIQRKGGEARSAFEACSKRLSEATIALAALDKPIEEAKSTLRQTVEDVRVLKGKCSELATLSSSLRKQLSSIEDDALARHERASALRQFIAELDKEIEVKRSALSDALLRDTGKQECQRLALLREQLVRQVASTAAAVAHEDVNLKKHHVNLSFVHREFDRVSSALLELYRTQSTTASSLRDALLEGQAYSPIAAAGLQNSIEAIEREALDAKHGGGKARDHLSTTAPTSQAGRGRRMDAAGSAQARLSLGPDARLMVQTLEAKLKAAKVADAASKRAATASTKYSRMAETVSMQRVEIGEALEMCREAMDRYLPSRVGDADGTNSVEGAGLLHLKDAPPLQRLEQLVLPAIEDDGEMVDLLRETFAAEILRCVQQSRANFTMDEARKSVAQFISFGQGASGRRDEREGLSLRDAATEHKRATVSANESVSGYQRLAQQLSEDITHQSTRDHWNSTGRISSSKRNQQR